MGLEKKLEEEKHWQEELYMFSALVNSPQRISCVAKSNTYHRIHLKSKGAHLSVGSVADEVYVKSSEPSLATSTSRAIATHDRKVSKRTPTTVVQSCFLQNLVDEEPYVKCKCIIMSST